ncbi:hypothetical protein [Burkholderia vietnamiensis]|uniref:hypothetical protein n=1 Tax=Burkholderia vietnamiensis TaxID=60552 RepID=UPI001589DBE4|nr:hypothetical protein [Burkholderia vietnamiensis]MCA8183808.1 hypothetical protein [Burkholderia vietnamiensis]
MSKLSKEDIQRIDAELSFPFGCVVLRCDSNTITIQVSRTKPRRYDLMVYVNGWFKMTYLKEAAPEHRFYRPVKLSAYKPAERAKIEKEFGKRKARKYFPNLDKTSTYYMPSWNTPSTMLRHFARVCQSVTLVSVGVAVNTSTEITAPETANA